MISLHKHVREEWRQTDVEDQTVSGGLLSEKVV